jgi:nucleoside-diphosphate-sugar epimerase
LKRILITGATGAFGPSVVARFESLEDSIVYTSGRSCTTGGNRYACDMTVASQIELLLNETKPDLIVHLAGSLSQNLDEAIAVNVNATHKLLDLIEKKFLHTRVVLIGSCAEYGAVAPEESPLQETQSVAPVSVYGLTKAWQSMLMKYFMHRGLDIVVARIFNLDGPGLSERLFIGRLERQIAAVCSKRTERIVLGPTSATRDYVSFDAAAVQLEVIARHGKTGEVYHVASGVPTLVRDILERYLAQNGLDMTSVSEAPESSNRVGYDVPVIFADISKTAELLLSCSSRGNIMNRIGS